MNRRDLLLGAVVAGAAVGTTLAAQARRPAAPGQLLHHEPITTPIKGARAWKVRYCSSDVNDVVHEVSGLVIAPSKRGSNRPVLMWCHGTTGLGDAACPSAQPDPARELITYFTPQATRQIDYGVPGLQGYIDAGYVVTATDYQGLGSPGMHQYMVSRTQARDAVFLAHAARTLPVGGGKKLLCTGWSQGGGTAAAVAELADGDFGDFVLLGTAAMSPGVTAMTAAYPGGMAEALTNPKVPPDAHLLMTVMGLSAGYPKLHLKDVLTPLGEEVLRGAWEHQPVHHLGDTVARLFRLKGPFMHGNFLELPDWKAAIVESSAGRVKPRCPVLVCIDAFDNGTVIPVPWQTAYVKTATELGGNVEQRDYPHDDHFSLPASCTPAVQAWFKQLLAKAR